jgi:opacity protein-like surface antigen
LFQIEAETVAKLSHFATASFVPFSGPRCTTSRLHIHFIGTAFKSRCVMKVFKSVLLAGVILVPMAVAAHATDMAPDVPSDVATTSGLYLRADVGASFLNWSGGANDRNYVGDLGIGYDFGDGFRTDLTGSWSGAYNIAPGATLDTRIILGNVYYDWKNDSGLTPYVGAGLGYGWTNAVGGGYTSTSGVAAGLALGVSYDMTNNLALDVGYRFHDIWTTGATPAEHQVTAGLRFKF